MHTLPITLITSNYTDWSSNLALESPRILLRGFATSQPTKEENSRPMLTQTLEGRHRVVSLCGTVSSQPPPANPAKPARASPPTSGVRPGNVQNIGTEWDDFPIKSVNNN